MRTTKQFDTWLRSKCGDEYHYYMNPPESVKLVYPALIYYREGINTRFADNSGYKQYGEYRVTLVSTHYDDPLVGVLSTLPLSRYGSHYVSSNLNHDVFTIYY